MVSSAVQFSWETSTVTGFLPHAGQNMDICKHPLFSVWHNLIWYTSLLRHNQSGVLSPNAVKQERGTWDTFHSELLSAWGWFVVPRCDKINQSCRSADAECSSWFRIFRDSNISSLCVRAVLSDGFYLVFSGCFALYKGLTQTQLNESLN